MTRAISNQQERFHMFQKLRMVVFVALSLLLASHAFAKPSPTNVLLRHPEVQGALAIIDAWIKSVRAYKGIPGISFGVIVDQEVLYKKGYGYANLGDKIPADSDTIYSICSISKLFTSIAVMQMRDAGKLSLRDPVEKHLPWFKISQQHASAGPARILGLLTHSSGLPRESDFPYWAADFPFPSRRQMIDRLSTQQTLYRADSQFQYSNLGLTLAGEIAASYAGTSYAEYVQQAILDPIGLSNTRTYFPVELHANQMAVGYTGKFRDQKRQPVEPFDTRAITPAAGFTSSLNDLAKFASWQFRALNAEADDVLDPNTLREMQRVHWVDPDWKVTWGLGFEVSEVDGTSVVGHSGGCPGYITRLSLVPKHKLAVIALTNAADGPAVSITANVLRTLSPVLGKAAKTGNDDAIEPTSHGISDDLSEYEGNYIFGLWGGEVAVRVWGKELAFVSLPTDTLDTINKLKRIHADRFVRVTDAGEPREAWVFERDEQGALIGVRRHSMLLRKIL